MDEQKNEEELMKNLSDGENMVDGVTPASEVPQEVGAVKEEGKQ